VIVTVLALAVGNQFSLAVLALVILPVMFWVAPVRPRAVLAIWTTAIAVAVVLLFAAYFFEPALFWQGMRHARWMNFEPATFMMSVSYRNAVQTIFVGSQPLLLALSEPAWIWAKTWPTSRSRSPTGITSGCEMSGGSKRMATKWQRCRVSLDARLKLSGGYSLPAKPISLTPLA